MRPLTAEDMRQLKVGDTITYVPARESWTRSGRSGYEVTVVSVGRKWLTLSNRERFSLIDGREDTQYLPGKLFVSIEAYSTWVKDQRERNDLANDLIRVCQKFTGYGGNLTKQQLVDAVTAQINLT